MPIVSEMISVSEMVFVPRNVRSFVLCEAMVGKAMPRKALPGKPTEMAAGEIRTATSEMCTTVGEMRTVTTEMPTATTEMPTATTKAATSSAMATATASSTMCERGGGPERQNAGQNQTDK